MNYRHAGKQKTLAPGVSPHASLTQARRNRAPQYSAMFMRVMR